MRDAIAEGALAIEGVEEEGVEAEGPCLAAWREERLILIVAPEMSSSSSAPWSCVPGCSSWSSWKS